MFEKQGSYVWSKEKNEKKGWFSSQDDKKINMLVYMTEKCFNSCTGCIFMANTTEITRVQKLLQNTNHSKGLWWQMFFTWRLVMMRWLYFIFFGDIQGC